ncbi:dTMP kinase [Nostoc sp. FACHB-152]|uniref:dTMP kinase n=1 Tax=unclassified Nostoc TaxID=2593658 RepID=UPI001688B94F|nr:MULTISPECIES: dTMP kinase [unclassified Nostoc]MBD2445684.1 dTMP kinase [Nostoc sp. FACHB-152]MBD2466798.1 dTMP kinase [Nostoc sp. FACHB-145]
MSGKLIVFEGVEGCGKTTQMQLCCEWLQSLGVDVIVTREPGGTQLGLELRRLLLEKSEDKPVAQITELLLYAADRAQHIAQELKPNLAAGKYILCDRYTDSTVAYQGYGRGLDMSLIDQLNHIATGGLTSDLTIWLDVDVEVGLQRKRGSEPSLDRIEQETIAFHRRVQQGYADLAAANPSRIVRIDGSLSKETVNHLIQEILCLNIQELPSQTRI